MSASTERSGPRGRSTVLSRSTAPLRRHLVCEELRAAIAYGSLKLAIEVKRSRTIRRADLHGLKQFRTDYPMARCVLLFGGDRREHRDGVELVPLHDALADPTLMLGMG